MRQFIPFVFVMISISSACETKTVNKVSELREIKKILDRERKAHLTKDIDLFFKNSLATDTVFNVGKGRVRIPTLEESKDRFTKYFNAVEFIRWDDAADPIFLFSNDSTMATVIIQKQVILKDIAAAEIDTTNFAWTSVYRKKNDQWKMVAITSTNQ